MDALQFLQALPILEILKKARLDYPDGIPVESISSLAIELDTEESQLRPVLRELIMEKLVKSHIDYPDHIAITDKGMAKVSQKNPLYCEGGSWGVIDSETRMLFDLVYDDQVGEFITVEKFCASAFIDLETAVNKTREIERLSFIFIDNPMHLPATGIEGASVILPTDEGEAFYKKYRAQGNSPQDPSETPESAQQPEADEHLPVSNSTTSLQKTHQALEPVERPEAEKKEMFKKLERTEHGLLMTGLAYSAVISLTEPKFADVVHISRGIGFIKRLEDGGYVTTKEDDPTKADLTAKGIEYAEYFEKQERESATPKAVTIQNVKGTYIGNMSGGTMTGPISGTNVAVGEGASVTVDARTFIQQAIEAVEASEATPEEKEEAKGILGRIAEHPLTSAAVGAALGAIPGLFK